MKFGYTIALVILFSASFGQDAKFLHRAQQALTDVIVHDVFSPPVASRIYVYPHIAAYEVMVKSQSRYPSLGKAIIGFPTIPARPSNTINFSLAAVATFLHVAKTFVFSEQIFSDSAESILTDLKRELQSNAIYDNSLRYGRRVGDSIIKWAAKDQYAVTRSMRRYMLRRTAGNWLPTPPAYIAAVEPDWGRIRPLIIDSLVSFRPPPPIQFSTDSSSAFYRQALEVYQAVNSLNEEQRSIALFWDCNPFFVNVSGHLLFATKKLSPGAHWLSIAGQVSRQKRSGMMTTCAAYCYTAIALFDGFISCWEAKYQSNYIRPETFINSAIDEEWRPLLQTPPFPEYTSGHSVISTAAASVLTAVYGEHFQFADSTETSFGLPIREFGSFAEAANEAAISRLYGGIHFRQAIENGQVEGRKIGQFVVKKLRIFQQQN